MSKWIKFGRKFNFTPKKASAVAMQYPAGAVDQVTDEAAALAIKNGAGVEVEAPANAEEAAAMRAGTLEAKPVKVKADDKPTGGSTAGAAGGKAS